MRTDTRPLDALRPVAIEPGYLAHAEGSALICCGGTRVLCAASVEERVPEWLQARNQGWVTGEYAMLPRATHTRRSRERAHLSGRTQEIQRLIGRALRASVDLRFLGERTIIVDCDVIEADGGTRTASVTGGYVALALCLGSLIESGVIQTNVFRRPVAAVSVGVVEDQALLDLCYEEDARAQVDMNVVMNAAGEIIEVQGTAEEKPFSRDRLDQMLDLAWCGVRRLMAFQRQALGENLWYDGG